MPLRPAALAARVVLLLAAPAAMAADPLTLDDAFRLVLAQHPELRAFEPRRLALAAAGDSAALRPEPQLGLEIENALGTGDLAGMRSAEVTLHLGSVLERGGKSRARTTLARARLDALQIEAEARRLDVLAEVARRYLALAAAEGMRAVAEGELAQRERALEAARSRHAAGAAPEAVVLTAEVALARARLARDRTDGEALEARRLLALLWRENEPDFGIPATDLLALPEIRAAAQLSALLERSPDLARFASEQRVREARLQLARSARSTDIRWEVGARHLQAGNDVALVAGISMPLGSRRRAEPEIRAAAAELAMLEPEREAAGLSLRSTLDAAAGRYRLAQLELRQLQLSILPILVRAEAAAQRAYEAGAASLLEWQQVQSELTATRVEQLEAALDARRALIEIQRLTGETFIAPGITEQEPTP
jgi:cobalt-zinc-cadmium efflux system outer membrane protein